MNATPALDFAAVAPLLLVAVGAVAALAIESFLRPQGARAARAARAAKWAHSSARVGAALSLFSCAVLATAITVAVNAFASGSSHGFGPTRALVVLDPLAAFATATLGGIALGVALLIARYLGKLRIHRGEAYALLLLSVAGMLLLVSAVDFVAVVLGVELMSLPLCALVALDRHHRASSEAALKLFLQGSFASALGLFGLALLYGVTGTTAFAGVQAGLPEAGGLGRVGVALVFTSFAFRVAVVPFHGWAPDVEQGAPTPVAAFVSVGMKTAAFVALLRMFQSAVGPSDAAMLDVLRVLAGGTVLIGSVMASAQTDLKRLLAYAGVANAGLLLLAFVAESEAAAAALLYGLVAFAFANLGAFAVLIVMTDRERDGGRIEHLTGLAQRRPALAAALTLFLFSLAGIPGTAGFIAKLQLLLEAVRAGEVGLALLAGLSSLVLFYALLRVPVVMFMRRPAPYASRPKVGSAEGLVLLVCAAAVLWLGLAPNGAAVAPGLTLIDWTHAAALFR